MIYCPFYGIFKKWNIEKSSHEVTKITIGVFLFEKNLIIYINKLFNLRGLNVAWLHNNNDFT